MTDLETRLRHLRPDVRPGADPAELRHRAADRRQQRRRRRAIGAASLVVAAVLALAGTLLDWPGGGDGRDEGLVAGPGPQPDTGSSDGAAGDGVADGTVVLGGVEGVDVEVTPRTGLSHGDVVEVRVDGLERLPGAVLLLCTGDLPDTPPPAAAWSCDTSSVVAHPGGDPGAMVPAGAVRHVSVSRVIHIRPGGDANRPERYDCATEPAGCVLAVAPYELPPRGVLVPLTFVDDGPLPDPVLAVEPATELQDGDEVTVRVEGLRPNGAFHLLQCGPRSDLDCDALDAWTPIESDAAGSATARFVVRADVYGYDGRTDCTEVACSITLHPDGGVERTDAPIGFARDATAPVPVLELDPPGPYADRQEITVQGSGFRPGLALDGLLAQCPADRDPRVEERCGYPAFGDAPFDEPAVVVAGDGTFSTSIVVWDSLPLTGPCSGTGGCNLGMVIPRGTIVAAVPLEFR